MGLMKKLNKEELMTAFEVLWPNPTMEWLKNAFKQTLKYCYENNYHFEDLIRLEFCLRNLTQKMINNMNGE